MVTTLQQVIDEARQSFKDGDCGAFTELLGVEFMGGFSSGDDPDKRYDLIFEHPDPDQLRVAVLRARYNPVQDWNLEWLEIVSRSPAK